MTIQNFDALDFFVGRPFLREAVFVRGDKTTLSQANKGGI